MAKPLYKNAVFWMIAFIMLVVIAVLIIGGTAAYKLINAWLEQKAKEGKGDQVSILDRLPGVSASPVSLEMVCIRVQLYYTGELKGGQVFAEICRSVS